MRIGFSTCILLALVSSSIAGMVGCGDDESNGGAAGTGNGGAAGTGTGGAAGSGGDCASLATKQLCDDCCVNGNPGGPAAMADMIAACLCRAEFCATDCADYCADPGAATAMSQPCMTCYSSKFSTTPYQQCYAQADADCQADATCSAFSGCITSCMGLPK